MPYYQVAIPPDRLLLGAEVDHSVFDVQPDPLMTPELTGRIVDEEERQRNLYAALSYLATSACLYSPGALEDTKVRIDSALARHFRPRPDMPTKKYAADRVWLAGTMGATNWLLAHHAQHAIGYDEHGDDNAPRFGPAGCYVTQESKVLPYPDGSPEDGHMNAVVRSLMDAAEYIAEASHDPDKTYARYAPVFRLEENIRESLPIDNPPRTTQLNMEHISPHPLDPQRVKISTAQFTRNVMHGIILLTEGAPRDSIGRLRTIVRDNVQAIEIAALYPKDIQRARMGIPGEPYESIRRARNITPHVIRLGGYLRFEGLEEPPRNGTMCSGMGAHIVPTDFRDCIVDSRYPVSAIRKHVELGLIIAPFTLFRDVRLAA
jgi:hypothetical protein